MSFIIICCGKGGFREERGGRDMAGFMPFEMLIK